MSKEISKSPEMLQKEARIKELHQQIKKARTTLKKLQTRLKNTKQEITDIQRTVYSNVSRAMEKMEALKAEIIALLKACKKFKGIEESDKEQLDLLMNDIEEITEGAEFDAFQKNKERMANPEFEEEQRAKMNDIFQQFQIKPPAEEQKNIRKVFINLSTNFHPDKGRNEQERKDYHSLMQQINEAYQAGDIDKLLELEKIYLSDKAVDFTGKAVTVDMLTQEIDRLLRDLSFIKNQVKRISLEVKGLRKSDLGNMLTEINRAEKHGMGIGAMTEDMDDQIERLTELQEVLQKCVEKGNMDPMKEMAILDPMDFLDDLDIDDEDAMMTELFGDLFGEAPQPVKNPKIPIGTSVQLKKNIPYLHALGLDLKGWQGRISNVYKTGKKVIYEVQLDSITLRSIPKKIVNGIIKDDIEFDTIAAEFSDLKKVPPRDTAEEALSTYRTMSHSKRWKYLKKKDHALMQEILLKFPEKSDRYNWEFWLKKNLKFPFTGESRGYFNYLPGEKMKIDGFYDWHEDGGLLVWVNESDELRDHPLLDIQTNNKSKGILDLYHEWSDFYF